MSKLICASAIDGARAWIDRAAKKLAETAAARGDGRRIGFPDTAYALPIIYSLTGERMETVGDLRRILARAAGMLPPRPTDAVWLPYLGNALDAGIAALFACEILEACKYVSGPDPIEGLWLGAANDIILRERGVEFVDGTAPGFAAITGRAPTNALAVRIARELQEKNLYVFMAGSTGGKQFAEQLAEEGVQLGWETRLVPFGRDVSALVYALGFANRVALSFGGIKPGDHRANLHYNKDRIFAFVLALGEVDADKYALAAGAINYGFPVIADTAIPQILPTGVCTYEHVVSSVPYDTMVDRALEVRGCKIKIDRVPIPVPYGPAFEGERVRKEDAQAEFGGNLTPAFEFVTSVGMDEIEDGVVEIVGPDIDAVPPGTALPLAIWAEVAGRKMQPDFESILERQIHHLVNGAEGIWHMGQRDIVWTRVSKAGFARGLRLRHYGDILHARFLSQFPAIVDKVKVTIVTDGAEVERRLAVARRVYDERNRRLASLKDEAVDVFYSCLLCQSFAPHHVCVITPERLGLCGAYNWLDGKAAYEIDKTGPNQPIRKGECLDPARGVWRGVNDYVYANSHKTVDTFCLYSIMDRPMTSCGCFEVICAYVPECNGILAVNREFTGDTPVGMTFSTLAGNVGGGAQTPGFMGIGKVYLTSRKFLFAEGGHARLVWMPKDLKALLAADLRPVLTEQGRADLLEKIADETVATDPAEIRRFMERVGHPALALPDLAAAIAGTTDGPAAATAPASAPAADAVPGTPAVESSASGTPGGAAPAPRAAALPSDLLAGIGEELKKTLAREIVAEVMAALERRLGGLPADAEAAVTADPSAASPSSDRELPAATAPAAGAAIAAIRAFPVRRETAAVPVHTVALGATKAEGGTRGRVLRIGGATAMPFHRWEGEMPHRPLVAMEVFDRVSEKYPDVLRAAWGDLLDRPADMARACVERCGADLISVRLDGTHPEKGGRSPREALKLVREVLAAVDCPVIVTGHNHFETWNEVAREVARGCAGENLLLNWAEQENFRTIAGMALAYGHTVVAQSPIDVNIAKQTNILMTNMDLPLDRIVIDPLTGALGYGIEYCYSVMERIRQTGLGGDPLLAGPMIVCPGAECAKVKEYRATEADFPAWGDRERRAALWELTTALALLYAGADLLVMYHPEAVRALKKQILRLLDGRP